MCSCRNQIGFFTEGHKNLGTEAQCAILKRYTTPHENSGQKGPSQGVIRHTGSLERSPPAPKFEDRSEEETLKQERCARRDAWNMATSILKLKEKDKATLYSTKATWTRTKLDPGSGVVQRWHQYVRRFCTLQGHETSLLWLHRIEHVTGRIPNDGSCPRGRPTVHHRVSTPVRCACCGVHVVDRED